MEIGARTSTLRGGCPGEPRMDSSFGSIKLISVRSRKYAFTARQAERWLSMQSGRGKSCSNPECVGPSREGKALELNERACETGILSFCTSNEWLTVLPVSSK